MRLHELEHIIRAAAEITNQFEFVVIGSQSILGSLSNPPLECTLSMEADIFPFLAEDLSDRIDGAIGEGSQFHETFGYYAQGVDCTTAVLPSNWRQRLVRVQSEATNGRIGYCLDPTDLFLSKCAANREKDRVFNRALLRHGIVKPEEALARVDDMPVDGEAKKRLVALIGRLVRKGAP